MHDRGSVTKHSLFVADEPLHVAIRSEHGLGYFRVAMVGPHAEHEEGSLLEIQDMPDVQAGRFRSFRGDYLSVQVADLGLKPANSLSRNQNAG